MENVICLCVNKSLKRSGRYININLLQPRARIAPEAREPPHAYLT